MKRIFSKSKFMGPSFNSWMRLLVIGLVLSIITVFCLQFAIHFQVWGRLGVQSTDLSIALKFVFQFMKRPQVIYSILACLTLFIFIVVSINRLFIGISVYSLVTIVAIVAEYMKMKTRDEPIVYSDMSEITAISGLTKMVDKNLLIVAVIGIIILILFAGTLELYTKYRKSGKFAENVRGMMFKQAGSRLGVMIVTFSMLATPFVANADQNTAILNHFGYQNQHEIDVDNAMVNGPIMTFVSNISSVIMREPAGYSAKEMSHLQKKYTQYADRLNETRQDNLKGQTVISVLSESLTNPNDVPNLKYKGPDVYKNIDNIKDKAIISGKMLSSGHGGGTANIEYMTIAGLPLATYAPEMSVPYSQVVPFAHKNPILASFFDEKEVLHPYAGMLYNRRDAYKKMGIQKFYTTDGQTYKYPDKYAGKLSSRSEYPADKNAYKFLLEKIDSANNKDSQFLQLMTIQNHLPYSAKEFPNSPYKMREPAVSDATKNQIETYITDVHQTDLATKKLIAKVEKTKRPITMVFYGDHWPVVFTFVDQNKQMQTSHETDYFIYQNAAARKMNKSTLQHDERPYASPSDFPALALKATNSKLTPFFALQTKFVDELPALANYTRDTFVDEQGHKLNTKNLTSKQKKLLHEFMLVQYDITAGNHYLDDSFTDNQ